MYIDHGLDIVASNLCSEIMLHSSLEYTYSCILTSLNLVHWDRIKNSDSAFVATVFLDCLCSEFIEASEGIPGLEKVRNFTIKGRAIGLGVMGFHSYLQSKGIPYISLDLVGYILMAAGVVGLIWALLASNRSRTTETRVVSDPATGETVRRSESSEGI